MLANSILTPAELNWSGVNPLTVPAVPTGMNRGVGTSPCSVFSVPERPAQSLAVLASKSIKVLTVQAWRRRSCKNGTDV